MRILYQVTGMPEVRFLSWRFYSGERQRADSTHCNEADPSLLDTVYGHFIPCMLIEKGK